MKIIGQGGAAGHGPENGAAAIEAALRAGVTAVELDVQFSRECVPVAFRDRTLEKAAGVQGRIRDQSARELSGYDIGFRQGDAYRGLHILTLEEAARMIPKEVELHLRLAEHDSITSRHLKHLMEVLDRRGGLARCLLSSSSAKTLGTVRSASRETRRSLRTAGDPRSAVKEAVGLGCEAIQADASRVADSLVEACREAGIEIIAYGADDPSLLARVIAMGVDGVCSSHPDRVAKATGGKSRAHAHARSRRAAGSPEPPPAPPDGEPAEEAAAAGPEPEGEAAAGDAGPAPKKRRRGRRGGKRVRARRETAAAARADSDAEPPPPAAAEPTASGETAPTDEAAAPQAASPAKKRRRGHRGGKRHRERRLRREASERSAKPIEESTEEA